MHDTITIRIFGQEYKVKTGGNEEHIHSLSRYINEKVQNVQMKGSAVSTTELIAMVMLNMADDVAQSKEDLENYKKAVNEKLYRLIDKIDTSMK